MHRPATWLALSLYCAAGAFADDPATSNLVLGSGNQLLSDGAAALEAGRFTTGIRLTLAGLEQPNNVTEQAAAYANLCAGHVALKRWRKALPHCDRSLGLDANNWRALNNRAAVYSGLEEYDRAMGAVTAALTLASGSRVLQKSLQLIIQHREAAARLDRRKKPAKA